MTTFGVTFRCDYCDDELSVGCTDDGGFYCADFHECFGENPGFVADYNGRNIAVTHPDVRVQVEGLGE